MKRITRFFIAIVIVGIFSLTAGGVWASQKFQGTVPGIPVTGGGNCSNTIDMGTAIFTALSPDSNCTITVELIDRDALSKYALPPVGLGFISDTFHVTMEPPTALFKVCYAYPPEFAEKKAIIYKLNEEANPQVWGEIPGAEVKDGVICATSTQGYITLIGKP